MLWKATISFGSGFHDELTGERTRAVNALTALIRIADFGIDARGPLGARKVTEISRWRPREEDLAAATARSEAVRRAKRIVALDSELTDNMNRIAELVGASPAAALVKETGIGPVTAAAANRCRPRTRSPRAA